MKYPLFIITLLEFSYPCHRIIVPFCDLFETNSQLLWCFCLLFSPVLCNLQDVELVEGSFLTSHSLCCDCYSVSLKCLLWFSDLWGALRIAPCCSPVFLHGADYSYSNQAKDILSWKGVEKQQEHLKTSPPPTTILLTALSRGADCTRASVL